MHTKIYIYLYRKNNKKNGEKNHNTFIHQTNTIHSVFKKYHHNTTTTKHITFLPTHMRIVVLFYDIINYQCSLFCNRLYSLMISKLYFLYVFFYFFTHLHLVVYIKHYIYFLNRKRQ